jgi:hypothetical protein
MLNSVKWFRIRVSDLRTGESKANVKIPAGLADFGLKMAARFAPESVAGLDMNDLMEAMKSCEGGLMVDVEDEEKGEHVEVFVE